MPCKPFPVLCHCVRWLRDRGSVAVGKPRSRALGGLRPACAVSAQGSRMSSEREHIRTLRIGTQPVAAVCPLLQTAWRGHSHRPAKCACEKTYGDVGVDGCVSAGGCLRHRTPLWHLISLWCTANLRFQAFDGVRIFLNGLNLQQASCRRIRTTCQPLGQAFPDAYEPAS